MLFVIDLKTRREEIAGISHQPYDEWMKQMARNLTDAIDGFLRDTRFLIHDRDPLFSASFCATLGAVGVETVKLPARSPNLNAYAERFMRSIKSECLSRMIPLGENHLRASIRAFVAHYHLERIIKVSITSSSARRRIRWGPTVASDVGSALAERSDITIETRRERTLTPI